ncbi:MAG: hypothetical protein PF450_04170 [Bacteroidales bacterium]|nr:hypothetical protein [Bacteroidales bacterium]
MKFWLKIENGGMENWVNGWVQSLRRCRKGAEGTWYMVPGTRVLGT